ncbi:transporter substrate-binding protein [Rhodobaculum claviforme]|uniref:N-acetylmuramoyl-L-alanine amidase n=1 Tax=Rhodobaculum claviforme TaxID=1549854 RepID=A0A934TIW1_9RHOB|nr:transporter substrate-binding protein [Rhodobaculum claviforme]MBK5926423.1 N-acetylmuramoyl-L-alanine amidase [Rhodobaculum claviforme]
MARRVITIGLLFSGSGAYARISRAGRAGALRAVAAVNADPTLDVTLVPVARDPQGNVDLYGPLCTEVLRTTGARHVIGTTTSWSRKEVIPALERAGGALWYPCPYEGYEASDHVVYTHACPNQHLIPLFDWVLPRFGARACLVGSNYIWGWEMSRIAHDLIADAGGAVLSERYLAIGDTDVDRLIDEIAATRPDFVLNSLVGPSSYRFLEEMARLAARDPGFAPDRCPILSCNLTECELEGLGAAAEGVISAGPYFAGHSGPGAWGDQPPGGFASSIEGAAFRAVRALARLLAHRPGAEALDLAGLLGPDGAQGAAHGIDPAHHHMAQPGLVAQVRGGRFEVIAATPAIAPDPYLARARRRPDARARLSLVRP